MIRLAAALAAFALAVSLLPAAAGDHAGSALVRAAEKDAIRAVTEPTFDTDDPYVKDDDLVIGLSIAGDARAYPVKVLTYHEIVDDVVGSVPVAVTYCPLCGTGLVFDRTADGDTLTFKVSGLLWNSDLVMYDTATESYWSQILGEAIEGPLHGTVLDAVDALTISLRGWRDLHPETKLLDRPVPACPPGVDCRGIPEYIDYDYDPYRIYGADPNVWYPVENEDGRAQLHPKAMVVGVRLGEQARAYAFSTLETVGVVNDAVGGTRIVVTFAEESAQVFARGPTTYTEVAGGGMEDEEGNAYDLVTGRGPAGRLDPVESLTAMWFAWFTFNPDTSLYGAARGPEGDDMGTVGAVLSLAAVASFGGAAILWIRRRRSRG